MPIITSTTAMMRYVSREERESYAFLDYVQAKEYHQTIHKDPEDCERHGLTHDITILTLHVARSCSDGDGLWRK